MIEITVRDTEDGDTQVRTMEDDYAVITAGKHYIAGVQTYANGTHVVTIKVDK